MATAITTGDLDYLGGRSAENYERLVVAFSAVRPTFDMTSLSPLDNPAMDVFTASHQFAIDIITG
jgi:hypothetical protein